MKSKTEKELWSMVTLSKKRPRIRKPLLVVTPEQGIVFDLSKVTK